MQTLAAHPLPAEGFVGMEIRSDRLTDKENAGAALLDTCKEVKAKTRYRSAAIAALPCPLLLIPCGKRTR